MAGGQILHLGFEGAEQSRQQQQVKRVGVYVSSFFLLFPS